MRNCPKKGGCGGVTEKKHCGSHTCRWWVCVADGIVFDREHIERQMPWNGRGL